MDITQLDQELRSKKIRPAYLLLGEERHLALTARRRIIAAVLKNVCDPDRFHAAETGARAVLDALKTPSLLAPWRLVIVEEANRWGKKEWQALGDFFKAPLSHATLVLAAEALTKTETKNLPVAVAVVECKKLYSNQATAWVNMEAKHLNSPISHEAAKLLTDCVGTDLGALSQALEKLVLFVGSWKIIQLEDVERVVANTAQRTVFNLTTAVGERKPDKALECLGVIIDQGEELIRAFAMIVRHFRLLARAQELLAGGTGEAGFAKGLGVHPFFAKDYAAQAKRFKKSGWARRFERLAACDRALKSSRVKPQAVLEKLILDLCK